MMSSFCMNFMPSPTSWNQPWNPPGSIGPRRLCMWLIILRRNVYPRISAVAGTIIRITRVLIARVVPQPMSTASERFTINGPLRYGVASVGSRLRYVSSVDVPQDEVERRENRDDVGDEHTAQHPRQDRDV